MIGTYSYSPGIWPLLATTLLVAALGVYSWRQRTVPGAAYFAVACVFWTFSLLALTVKTVATDPTLQLAFHTFQATLQLPIVTALACFTLEYVQPGRWLTRRTLLWLAAPPLLAALMMLTNNAHRFFWRDLSIDTTVRLTIGPGGWIAIGYAIVLALVQAAALLWLFVRSPQHRWPAALMLSALMTTRSIFVLAIYHPDLTTALEGAFLFTIFPVLVYAIALFGFRIFDPLPAARQVVLEQLDAGVIVFDVERRIVRLNPAAERMLGLRSAAVRGRPWHALAHDVAAPPTFADAIATCLDATPLSPEFTLGSRDAARQYTPLCLPLHDFRGLCIGYLLMLDDVTETRQAQAQIVAQQRTLAALHEREALARDLHDSIGQVLGYASFQVEATIALIDAGQTAAAAEQLARLADVLREAHGDVREQILRLRSSTSPQQPFAAALRHYLDGFSSNYAIGAKLTIDAGHCVEQLAPETQMQLFRIVQEVLSNARKHSGARSVAVTVAADDNKLSLWIADDGCGFDPEAAANGDHLGLRTMAERTAELGGSLRIESTPGAGTRVGVEVPRKER
ncbi:MAG: histidine kinase N-terminal 7TM domain-containing protein [Caldilinea sp.]